MRLTLIKRRKPKAAKKTAKKPARRKILRRKPAAKKKTPAPHKGTTTVKGRKTISPKPRTVAA